MKPYHIKRVNMHCAVIALAGVASLSLAACGGDGGQGVPGTGESLADGAVYAAVGSGYDESATDIEVEVGSGDVLVLRADPADTGQAGNPGAVFRIPGEVERQVTGMPVVVSIRAKGGPFRATYFTLQVGNSGPHEFEGSDSWAVHRFDYSVHRMRDSQTDALKIMPTSNEPVEIDEVAIHFAEGEGKQPGE